MICGSSVDLASPFFMQNGRKGFVTFLGGRKVLINSVASWK